MQMTLSPSRIDFDFVGLHLRHDLVGNPIDRILHQFRDESLGRIQVQCQGNLFQFDG